MDCFLNVSFIFIVVFVVVDFVIVFVCMDFFVVKGLCRLIGEIEFVEESYKVRFELVILLIYYLL